MGNGVESFGVKVLVGELVSIGAGGRTLEGDLGEGVPLDSI